jgi:hypothetical protein
MPIFTAIAAGATALATAVGFSAATAATIGSVAAFAARTLLTIGISKLIAKRANTSGAQDAGSRVQLAPATDNKLPVIYGSAFVSGAITDAKISTDNKTMWYVVSIAEHTDTTVGSGYSFANVYYDGKLVTFGTGADSAKVMSLSNTMTDPPEVDEKVKDNIWIYLFTNGSSSGVNTGGQSAIDILSDSEIASDQRWNGGIYTANGQTASMTNTCFAVIKVKYNQDAGTTNLGSLTFQLQNSLTKPGAVILDYLQNTRYGCAVPLNRIDTASLTALDVYADDLITYTDVNGDPATQARYRIDGPINTGYDCLTNLQQLVDSCDSWLQYSEITGKWRVVINQAYTDYTTFEELFIVNDSNLVGGIEVNPTDLNNTYNEMEVQYPNRYIKDQTDFQLLSLWDVDPTLLSPNEPPNKLTIQLPQVNNAVQAKYLGVRRLYQSREELVINFATDYSGITVEAGDVIRVTNSQYGWEDKLFRVSNVAEEKYGDGSLGARLTAFEYSDTVYTDNPVQDYIPASNSGLSDPNIIGTPDCPTANVDLTGTVAKMTISAVVPSVGQVLYMDFNYGNSNNSANHQLYASVNSANAQPYAANTVVSIEATDLAQGNYYWSVTAKNNLVGARSSSCPGSYVEWPGPSVTEYDANSNTGGIGTTNLVPTGVTPGTYTLGGGNITIGVDGRVTVISSGGSNVTPLSIYDEGNIVGTNIGNINFVGNSISAQSTGTGNVTVYVKDGSLLLGGTEYSTAKGGNVYIPVDVYSTSTRNIPVYIPGYGIDANNIYPYALGTSNSSPGNNGNNYYLENSTGPFTPYFTHQLTLSDGNDNWFTVTTDNNMAGKLAPTDTYLQGGGVTMFSDTNGTVVQLMRGIKLASFGDYFYCDTTTIQTFTLFKNLPVTYAITVYWSTPGYADDIVEAAILIRNVTPGSNLTIVESSITSSRVPYWPFS